MSTVWINLFARETFIFPISAQPLNKIQYNFTFNSLYLRPTYVSIIILYNIQFIIGTYSQNVFHQFRILKNNKYYFQSHRKERKAKTFNIFNFLLFSFTFLYCMYINHITKVNTTLYISKCCIIICIGIILYIDFLKIPNATAAAPSWP